MILRNLLISAILIVIAGLGVFGLLNLDISEDLNTSIPSNSAFEKIMPWLEKSKKQLVISIDIDENNPDIESLSSKADSLTSIVLNTMPEYITDLSFKNNLDPEEFVQFMFDNLPYYLNESDYQKIDSLITLSSIEQTLSANKQTLTSPEGLGLKKWILKDPLHLVNLGLSNIYNSEMTDDLISNQGLFISPDRKKLYIHGNLAYNISDSKKNDLVATKLSKIQEQWNHVQNNSRMSFFGTFLIADANAKQIQKDIKNTVTLAIIFIVALLIVYYRNVYILLLFLIPGCFGIFLAFGFIYFIQGNISGLALGASAVIFGIVADYSFHFFSMYKKTNDAVATRNQLLLPLLVSSSTTIIAFLSLIFTQSKALQDFGLFTSLSLGGTLFFVLVGLPMLMSKIDKKIRIPDSSILDSVFEKINVQSDRPNKKVMLLILVFTMVSFYFALNIQFEDDLYKLNFYPDELKETEVSLQNINPDLEQRINVISSQINATNADEVNQTLYVQLQKMSNNGQLSQVTSLGAIVIPERVRMEKIKHWRNFWSRRKGQFQTNLYQAAHAQKWRQESFDGFLNHLSKPQYDYEAMNLIMQSNSLSHLILSNDDKTSFITSFVCPKDNTSSIKQQLANMEGISLVDGQSVIEVLISTVKEDFNFLLIVASIAVFVTLLLIYGSLELTLVSFIPMAISWIWILGIASMLDIKFNFVNIILSTFIFGLGDDFSIFMTDGLQKRYESGKKVLAHYKTGIILSSLSTIVGTGVLIFAKHPALRSIAAVSVIGIVVIVFVSFAVQPFLFRLLITRRTQMKKPPLTLFGIAMSIYGFSAFVFGCLLRFLVSLFIRSLFFVPTKTKKSWGHHIIASIAGLELDILFRLKKRYLGMSNLDFDKPSIIIANHSSFLDILALIRLHPKIILLTNKWVFDSPLFGSMIRYADYIPAFLSIEDNLPKIKNMVAQGYSIAVFPEGRRSEDAKVKRFHKGAFYISEKLELDITPVLFPGTGYLLPKNDFYLKNGFMDTVVFPRIKHNASEFGIGYKERSKKTALYLKQAYADYLISDETKEYPYQPILYSYIYKGPILPWYFRIKWNFEKTNYERYNQLIGLNRKNILDLGCGYGYLSYFLYLRNKNRIVQGIDYDEAKVEVAQNSYLKSVNIDFQSGDVSQYQPDNVDAILLADVLHYLSPDKQMETLNNCHKGLNDGGIILIRDGISDMTEKHKWTENSEKWSTQLIKFNKTQGALHFFKKQDIIDWAATNSYTCDIETQSEKSSNALFVLTKG